jgi:uncharacterized caspase-like protein
VAEKQITMGRGELFKVTLLAFLTVLLTTATEASYSSTRNLVVQNVKAGAQKRVALVIGNSNYESREVPKLANPVNDARSMAEALNKLGFEVTEVTNATQRDMNLAIASFGAKLEPNTVALFYYAGHGLQVNGKNYLVPTDAEISSPSSIPAMTVDMDTVLDQLAMSSVSIVILDACRNNPFRKARSIGGGGLAPMDVPKGSYIAYATAPGKTAQDGTGANGLYTQELLKNINTPGITLEEVFKRVRANVARITSDEQLPWDSSSLTGDFYFNGKPSDSNEIALWGRIKDSSSIADFQTYLSQYPKGRFVKEAEEAKARLERTAQIEQQHREEETKALATDRQKLEEERLRMEKEGKSGRKAAPAPYVPPAF